MKTVILFKTHLWNESIEDFAIKIYEDIMFSKMDNTYDFFILMHSENNLYSFIKSETIKSITKCFTENTIKNLYTSGFYTMWLSNHWILMWFFKNFGNIYDYFWSIEYDVRISGNSFKIWSHNSTHDFLYVMGNHLNFNNKFRNYYVGNKLSAIQKYYGFLQLARYSKAALKYLDSCFEMGENGQDELITFSLLNRGNFLGSKKFLIKLVRGKWTWDHQYAQSNKNLYDQCELNNHHDIFIFHPVY